MLWGALLGAVTSLPVMGLMFLGDQLAGLPFVPFDLFDWFARAMPGSVLTVLIDTMVSVILLLKLGEISHTAKLLEQGIAIGSMVMLSVLFGAVIAYMLARRTWPSASAPR